MRAMTTYRIRLYDNTTSAVVTAPNPRAALRVALGSRLQRARKASSVFDGLFTAFEVTLATGATVRAAVTEMSP